MWCGAELRGALLCGMEAEVGVGPSLEQPLRVPGLENAGACARQCCQGALAGPLQPRTRGLGPRRRAAAGKQAGRQAGWQAGKQAGACLGEARHPLGLRRVEKAFEAPRSSHWPVGHSCQNAPDPVFSGKLSRVGLC